MRSDTDQQDGTDQSENQQQFTDPASIQKTSDPQTGGTPQDRPQDAQDRPQVAQDRPRDAQVAQTPPTAQNRSGDQQDGKQSKFDYYVHLANGEVRRLTKKAFGKATEESGTPNALNEDGVQHTIIGVYPREVDLPETKDDDDE